MFKFVGALLFALMTAVAGASGAFAGGPAYRITPGAVALSAGHTIQFTPVFIPIGSVGHPLVVGSILAVTADRAAAATVPLTWKVNGVPGGNSSVGTITNTGFYTAPSSTPNAQVVRIRAVHGSRAAVAIVRIVIPGTLAPTGNPLVAALSFTSSTDAMVSVRFGTDTSYGLGTSPRPTPTGGGQVNLLVAGMMASTVYHMQLVADFPDGTEYVGQDQTVASGAVAPGLAPQISISPGSGPTPYGGGVEVLSLDDYVVGAGSTQAQAVVTDLQGNLIWYFDDHSDPETQGKIINPVKLLSNGDMLMLFSNPAPDGADSVLREIDLAGNTIWELTASQLQSKLAAAGDFPGATVVGTHHDFLELPNGNIIVLVSLQEQFSNLTGISGTVTVTGDGLVELDQNHSPVWTWSEFDHMDVNRHPFNFPDWTHSNAIVYSPDDRNLIVSIRHQNWTIKIDYNGGHGTGNNLATGLPGRFCLAGRNRPCRLVLRAARAMVFQPQQHGRLYPRRV